MIVYATKSVPFAKPSRRDTRRILRRRVLFERSISLERVKIRISVSHDFLQRDSMDDWAGEDTMIVLMLALGRFGEDSGAVDVARLGWAFEFCWLHHQF